MKNWMRCCKTRFSGAPSSDSNEANREESPEKLGSNGKRRMRGRCGRERKGCRLTRFALSRRWRFYSREFTTLRSQPFLRSEIISEFSRQAGLFSLFPASSRNAALRSRCESRERKQREPFPSLLPLVSYRFQDPYIAKTNRSQIFSMISGSLRIICRFLNSKC